MGMLSRAMKKRKDEMLEQLDAEKAISEAKGYQVTKIVTIPIDLAETLAEMANIRQISVEQMVITYMAAVANSYKNQKILRLIDIMPYGKYKGVLVEDMIRSDPRYCNYMANSDGIFCLDEEATELLKELS